MVLKRSRIRGGSLQSRLCRTGKVVSVQKDGFQIKFSDREIVSVKEKDAWEYNSPSNKKEVVCLYGGSKGNKYLSEVRSKTWDLYYRKEI